MGFNSSAVELAPEPRFSCFRVSWALAWYAASPNERLNVKVLNRFIRIDIYKTNLRSVKYSLIRATGYFCAYSLKPFRIVIKVKGPVNYQAFYFLYSFVY